jgi:hypothetical protein
MNFIDWLFGKRTIAIQCDFCNWEKEETDCEHCQGTGLIIFETWIVETLKEKFKIAWVR